MKVLVALILVTVFLWTFFRPIFDYLGSIVGKIFGIKYQEDKKRESKKD